MNPCSRSVGGEEEDSEYEEDDSSSPGSGAGPEVHACGTPAVYTGASQFEHVPYRKLSQ